jgi:hypothetical protein
MRNAGMQEKETMGFLVSCVPHRSHLGNHVIGLKTAPIGELDQLPICFLRNRNVPLIRDVMQLMVDESRAGRWNFLVLFASWR